MLSNRQAPYVLKNKKLRVQFANDSNKMVYKMVAWILEYSFSHHAKTLAWSTTKYYIYIRNANCRMISDIASINFRDALTYGSAIWKVEFVHCTMDRVELHCRFYRKAEGVQIFV